MAQFFIDRPIFAIVISIVIMIAGGLAMVTLPIAQYPQLAPPTVEVEINYPGANAETVEQSIATVVEQEVNGAENMIYFSSKSSSDGRYVLTCTFALGTNLDLANVDVNNRVNKAVAKLPPEAVAAGISVKKKSPDLLLCISLFSPDDSYDDVFLSNYASINLIDSIGRTPGVGSTMIGGQRDYAMRVWLRPDKLTRLGLTSSDIADAVREQNILAPTGAVGQPPATPGTEFQYAVNVKGRLESPDEFADIIVRTNPDGSILRMRDVSRTELAAKTYTSLCRLDGKQANAILVYQLPGANALETAKGVRAVIDQKRAEFPSGLEVDVTLDTTEFVTTSIDEVISALRDAIILVLLVVLIFLGNFRATIIPMVAIPVCLIGTFAFFVLLGFSINTLTLFGLVLAVGIVVDDAIVVVEAVEHHIRGGMTPVEATHQAMREVSGPVIATSLILCAVFVPVAFMGGITGRMYQQFALTLSVSVILSSVIALTLSPALCAMLLKPRKQGGGPIAAFFRGFDRTFEVATTGYMAIVKIFVRRLIIGILLLGVISFGSVKIFNALPSGFVSEEDLGYYFVALNLPDGASLERTDALAARAEAYITSLPGVKNVATLVGLNILTNAYTSNNASLIVVLENWADRKEIEKSVAALVQKTRQELASYPEAIGIAAMPPAIPGIGVSGGFQFELQDRTGQPADALAETAAKFVQATRSRPELTGLFSPFRTTVPQIDLELDRDKIRTLEVPINMVFESLQVFLGGLQVNDFNLYGRVYKVMLQAEPEFRANPANIADINVRSQDGAMVPLSTITTVGSRTGPDLIQRYNMYRTAEISGAASPGFSSGQALTAMEEVAADVLPQGYGFEWTGTAFQEKQAGGSQAMIFILGLVFVFLFLAALYESWSVPFAIILGMPLCIFGAVLATWSRDYVNDTYVQIAIVLLIGLSAKTAILIVEFAKSRYEEGMSLQDATLEAARLRFRAILMTAFSFVLGVLPLVTASGAGAVSRRSLGSAVFGGMSTAILFGIFLTPGLYVLIEGITGLFKNKKEAAATAGAPPEPPPAPATGTEGDRS